MSQSVADKIDIQWNTDEIPPDVFAFDRDIPSDTCLELLLTDLFHRWKRGLDIPLAGYIGWLREYDQFDNLVYELLAEDFGFREQNAKPLPWDQLTNEFSIRDSTIQQLRAEFSNLEKTVAKESSNGTSGSSGNSDNDRMPRQIGRYRIERELGRGAFGRVLLAQDEELHRKVAIKIPYSEHIQQVGREEFLREARIVAALDHACIVPVYDIGVTNEGVCYVVSKFICGGSLAARMTERFSQSFATKFIAGCARALHHAHKAGVVHRDIKPANLLLDEKDQPWITDFGLALGEHDHTTSKRYVGTPAWMSPEQARGEGHRVDARCDIYSLGVVFYELLTGRRPFDAKSSSQLLKRIGQEEVRPPRQISDSIPRELDRICLRALARRASDRYSTALDFAEDLDQASNESDSTSVNMSAHLNHASSTSSHTSSMRDSSTDRESIAVVPRGLRSFGFEDAGFFQSLLPGPRATNGIPDTIRFWVSRLESRDPDHAYPIALLYGPSGAGKSSLLKAGVIPLLDASVECAIVECSRESTIESLLRQLSKLHPELAESNDLVGAFRWIRRQAESHKTIVVLDQFEQWLSGWTSEIGSPLVEALRQCDGVQLQCVLLARDDFWMATTRLMRELDVPLIERKNSAGVDLFDKKHARRVLRKFGAAYGALSVEPTRDNLDFIEQAVDAISEDGRVIPVRLALFADMLKSRDWSPATLRQIGGVQGVGIQFLDETFGERAPPQHRLHASAARKLLSCLLPEAAGNIKGVARAKSELQEISGYLGRDADFADLLRILNQELCLISPVDTADSAFQLTHDYLVPSLRAWLTRHEKSTRSGRVRIQLRERAADWKAKPETRRLPSVVEYASILLATSRHRWTEIETKLMRSATRLHLRRLLVAASLLGMVAFAGYELNGRRRANELLQRLLAARITEVPDIVREAEPYRRWLDPLLENNAPTLLDARSDPELRRQRTLMDLALLPRRPALAADLADPLLASTGDDFRILLRELEAHSADMAPTLWVVFDDDAASDDAQLRAACSLAVLDPENERWATAAPKVVNRLVHAKPTELGYYLGSLRKIAPMLRDALHNVYRVEREEPSGLVAAEILNQFFAEDAGFLIELSIDTSPEQLAILRPAIVAHESAKARIEKRFRAQLATSDSHVLQADMLGLLASLGESRLLEEHLAYSEDNSVRSQIVVRYGAAGGRPEPLVNLLRSTDDASVKRALIQALGGVLVKNFPAPLKRSVAELLLDLYQTDPDPGVHSSAEWTLGRWGQHETLKTIEDSLRTGDFVGHRRWCVTNEGYTLARIPAGSFVSAKGETKTVPVAFAIATKETTDLQYSRFLADTGLETPSVNFFTTKDLGPAIQVSWYRAAHYCNWLSEQEGIPKDQWVYLPNKRGYYQAGMRIVSNPLQRTGYQIPPSALWRYAAKGSVSTQRHFGNDTSLLRQYAWSLDAVANRAQPVGKLKPNDMGLFDTLGNAAEWSGPSDSQGFPFEEETFVRISKEMEDCVGAMGGSFRQVARFQNAGGVNHHLPNKTTIATSVRVMRVLPITD